VIMSYPLIVAQYAIQGHPCRTEHWSLAVLFNDSDAYEFELVGNYDTFVHVPKHIREFSRSVDLRGGYYVGHIAADYVDLLKTRLADVPVIRGNPDFDCQTWVMEGLRLIKEDGVVTGDIGEAHIRRELQHEKELCEGADDTLEARISKT
jgi:hypothetical protein